jgi:glycosyltransferase involved in cell wall biosynthesis
MTERRFSIVIPTRDRPRDLAACLQSIMRADNGRLAEIIVVDDGSSDPVRIAPDTAHVPIRLLRHPLPTGPDTCRNEAVALVSADYVGFLDDDARVAHDWFDVAAIAVDDGLRAFTGRVLPFDVGVVSRARQWRYDRRYESLASGQPTTFLAGGNSVVARQVFLDAGGFPVRSSGGDNGLVARMAAIGVTCLFVHELRILHRNGKGFPAAAVQAWRAGRSTPACDVRDALADCRRTLAALRRAPLDVGVVNGTLQLVNTAGRLTAKAAS